MKNKGFTLIELLVVISIIGLLSSVVLASLSTAKLKGRDARRLIDMRQILTALALYRESFGSYPSNTDTADCSGWDTGFNGGQSSGDPFIQPLETAALMSKTPGDAITTSACGGYRYYRYSAGSSGCNASRGAFFVLGVTDMQTSGRPYPSSPGWSCPSRNWQNEFDWVTGGFEN